MHCLSKASSLDVTFSYRRKSGAIRTDGSPSIRASVSALWGPKVLENVVDLDFTFEVETDKSVVRRQTFLGKNNISRFVIVFRQKIIPYIL